MVSRSGSCCWPPHRLDLQAESYLLRWWINDTTSRLALPALRPVQCAVSTVLRVSACATCDELSCGWLRYLEVPV